MRYDVIVAGAGPGGSTAARECASRGLSVLMLDKSDFPRDKPCGGGVSIRAAGELPFDVTPVVERVIYRAYVTERQSRGYVQDSPEKITYLTQRSRLDAFLVERAIDAGVTFRQREPVRAVERRQSHVVVRTTDTSYEGSTLVAADGANGNTARLAGVDVSLQHGLALEGNVTPAGGVPAKWQDAMGLDFGDPPGGYGWIFPKEDHLNIGLGGWRHVGPSLRERLFQLVRFYGFETEQVWGLRGFHLPIRRNGSPLVDGNVLLVGDAAGLIDTLTGEGIYAALHSGRKAAKHISAYLNQEAPDLEGYRRELEHGLLLELRVSGQFNDIFNLWPGLFLGVDRRTSILWKAVVLLFRGERTYLYGARNLGSLMSAAEFISDLIRVAPSLRRIAGLRDPEPPGRFFRRWAQTPGTNV